MEIVWYGQSCFRLRGRGCAVVTDPYSPDLGYRLPRLTANIVTISHNHPDHNYTQAVRAPFYTVAGPGEYEVAGAFVIGVATDETSPALDAEHGRNTAYLVEMEGLTVCHLGHITQAPTQAQIEQFDGIDILLIPVGGRTTLTAARAAEVVNMLEPSLVIPMYYKVPDLNTPLATVTRFLTEMAVELPEAVDTLTVTKTQLSEQTQVALLTPKR
jgi:L-ascorbate metabolism protein UlaG (beta-lactamase superfamily)